MSEIDAAALERESSPPVLIVDARALRGSGSSDAVSGFSAYGRVYVDVVVGELRRTSKDGSVAITVQESDDGGSTWSTAAGPFTFTSDGVQRATVTSPADSLRVAWATSGVVRSCRLAGVWVTPGSLDAPGGGGPIALDDLTDVDTAGGAEGDVLTQQSDGSFAMEAPSGGSLPDPTVAAVLASIPEPEEGATSAPTLDEIDTSYNIFTAWTAERDYSQPFAFNADVVIVLLPSGSANVFAAEINGASTGTDEPDWDTSAPDVGDTVSDGDVTWENIGPQSAWPPAPVAWAADTAYDPGTLIWPPTPNGHLYLVYPGAQFTAASEPTWPIKGAYVAGDTGYVYDLGTKLATIYAGGDVSILSVPDAAADEVALARLFIHIRDRLGYIPAISVVTSENGYTFLAVNNETFILNNPDADSPPLGISLVEGGGVVVQHVSLKPSDSSAAYALTFNTDNAVKFQADLQVLFSGSFIAFDSVGLPADGDLPISNVAIHPDDSAGLQLKFKTSGSAIKTATIPWDT